jgi:hypothetical protein
LKLILPVAVVFSAIGFVPLLISHAQKGKDEPVSLSGVSTHQTASGTLVSIAADGPLNRAQTWQDGEGYHVVVPYAATNDSIKTGKGVKVRRVGKSLEILVQTRPGSNVTVQPLDNRLNLSIDGKLQPRSPETESIEDVTDSLLDPHRNVTARPRTEPTPTSRAKASAAENNTQKFVTAGDVAQSSQPTKPTQSTQNDKPRLPPQQPTQKVIRK